MTSWNRSDCAVFSGNIDELNDFFAKDVFTKYSITILYVIMTGTGAGGNLLMLLTLALNADLIRPGNYFIPVLAMSDLCMSAITAPLTLHLVLFRFWYLGDFLCKLVASMQAINTFVSTLSINAIGFDRLMTLRYLNKPYLHKQGILLGWVAIWVLSILMALPMVLFAKVVHPLHQASVDGIEQCGLQDAYPRCVEEFPSSTFRMTFAALYFIFQYKLPLTMLICSYVFISRRVQAQAAFRQKSQKQPKPVIEGGRLRNSQRATVTIVAIVSIFGALWLPFNVYMMLVSIYPDRDRNAAFAFCHVTGLLTACTNPLLYGVINDKIRACLLSTIRLHPLRRLYYKALGRPVPKEIMRHPLPQPRKALFCPSTRPLLKFNRSRYSLSSMSEKPRHSSHTFHTRSHGADLRPKRQGSQIPITKCSQPALRKISRSMDFLNHIETLKHTEISRQAISDSQQSVML